MKDDELLCSFANAQVASSFLSPATEIAFEEAQERCETVVLAWPRYVILKTTPCLAVSLTMGKPDS